MKSAATSVDEYLAELPPDRREAIAAVRQVILANLDPGFAEEMQYGMIGYFVPHSLYPAGYHCDPKQPLGFAGLASQKNHMAVYLMCVYGSTATEKWFRDEWAKSGKKLDMGKSCIRFKKLEDISLDAIGKAIGRITAADYIRGVEATLAEHAAARPARKKSAQKASASSTPSRPRGTKKRPAKKQAAKKHSTKKNSVRATSKPANKKSSFRTATKKATKTAARKKR